MREWFKNYLWFISTSASYLNKSILWVICFGQVKAFKHASYMTKYNKLTPEQKEYIYLTEDRTMEFNCK